MQIKKVVGQLESSDIFPNPEVDIWLSSNGQMVR